MKTVLAAILVIVFSACNNKAKTETKVAVATEEHEHSDVDAIQFNEGKKWKVDDKMLVHIRAMEKEVAGFDNSKPENYPVLADNLKKNLDLLTSNCTMEGQAHDELHKWLLPFIDLVDAFSKDKSTAQFTEIQHAFTTFNTYFE